MLCTSIGVTRVFDPLLAEEFGQLKLKKNKLDQRLRLETKKNEVSQTHFKQLQNMVRTQIDQLVGDQKQQVERFDEIVEDMIDALYDYEEQMEEYVIYFGLSLFFFCFGVSIPCLFLYIILPVLVALPSALYNNSCEQNFCFMHFYSFAAT